ncbi:MAG TPA: response regulator [Thermoanaerobaculia bacterium]|nr:response regulator [Thermoanaerobaculia bacterium]
MIAESTRHRILIVDDEPDIAVVTKLSLKGLRFGDKTIEFESAATGKEAVAILRERPDVSVILLDVVMETSSAGLDACRAIRDDLGNHFVRILLRTGQPGIAPEKKTIEDYDIDGYLPKAELTTNRLYAAVRAALKSYEELVQLERHRRVLALVHESVVSLHSFEPLDATLRRILEAAATIVPSTLAILHLESFDAEGGARRWHLRLSGSDENAMDENDDAIVSRIGSDPALMNSTGPKPIDDGIVVPLRLHRELGGGWLYLETPPPDSLSIQALGILAAHAENALYSAVAQAMLNAREGPFYNSLIV